MIFFIVMAVCWAGVFSCWIAVLRIQRNVARMLADNRKLLDEIKVVEAMLDRNIEVFKAFRDGREGYPLN